MEETNDEEFVPTRWWKVLGPDGELWCETSDKKEAVRSMRPGDTLHHLFEKIQHEWREVPSQKLHVS
jgi:hypothetical protein